MDQTEDIQFDGWTLIRKSGELSKAGRSVRLRPQPLQILEELLAHPGEVVNRAELIAKLWPKGIVDFETGLNSAVRRLRRALSDDADTPKYIETIPRKGYRFIGEIVSPREHASAPAGQSVLPARPHSGIAHGGARAAMTFAAIAAVFGLGASGDSQQRQPSESFASMSRSLPLPSTLPASSSASVPEELRKARYFLERRSHGDLEFAKGHFNQVLGLDHTRAGAYAGLATVYWLKTVEGEIPREAGLPKVKAFAERALSLDATEVEAMQRLALYYLINGDRVRSAGYFRRARELNPNDSLMLGIQSSMAFAEDRLEDSVELSRRAVAAAPLNLGCRYNLASTLYNTGHLDEALKVMRELLEFDSGYRADIMAYILVINGRHQAALDLANSWADGPDKSQALALAHFGLGNLTESDKALATLIAQVRDTEPLRIAEVYAYRRANDAAFDWLHTPKQYVYGRDIAFPVLLQTMKHSPFIAPLRSDPRWEQWISSANTRG